MKKTKKKYEYLETDWWKEFRKKIVKARKVCEICSSRKRLNVHHRHYKNVGRETEVDVYLLCEEHHNELHKRSKNYKITYDEAFEDLKVNPIITVKKRKVKKKKKKRKKLIGLAKETKIKRDYYSNKERFRQYMKESRAKIKALRAKRLASL